MEQVYQIHASETDVYNHVLNVASSHRCHLRETVAGEGLPAVAEGRRIDIVKKYGSKPIARVALSFAPDRTQLLVSDEPHSEREGRDFDTEAFDGFRLSLVADFPAHWKSERVS